MTLRTLFGFGFTMLEDPECERLCGVMHLMRFPMAKPRTKSVAAFGRVIPVNPEGVAERDHRHIKPLRTTV